MTGRMELVELVEGDDAPRRAQSGSPGSPGSLGSPGSPGPDSPRDARDHALAWARRHWRWLVPTAVVVVAALVTTQGVADARERERLARLAAVPGVLAPVSRDLRVQWRGGQDVGDLVRAGAQVGDRVVGVLDDARSFTITALDLRTGARAWSTPVDRPPVVVGPSDQSQQTWSSCFAAPRTPSPPRAIERRPAPGDAVVVCTAQQQGEIVNARPDVSLWTVDPASGRVLQAVVVPGQAQLQIVGAQLVLATPVTSDGTVAWRLAASDLATGDPAWTFTTSPQPVEPAEPIEPADDPGDAAPQAADSPPSLTPTPGGHLVVATDAGELTELDGAGRVVRSATVEKHSWVQATRGGVLVSSVYASGTTTGSLLLPDGRRVPTHDLPVYLAVDDGSAPDVLFTAPTDDTGQLALTARSATTGASLWTADTTLTPQFLLRGTLYATGPDRIVALDARTGVERWHVDTDYAPQQLGTDGDALLVPEPSTRLAALSLGDGHLLWRQSLADTVAGGAPTWTVQNLDVGSGRSTVVGWLDDGSVVVLG